MGGGARRRRSHANFRLCPPGAAATGFFSQCRTIQGGSLRGNRRRHGARHRADRPGTCRCDGCRGRRRPPVFAGTDQRSASLRHRVAQRKLRSTGRGEAAQFGNRPSGDDIQRDGRCPRRALQRATALGEGTARAERDTGEPSRRENDRAGQCQPGKIALSRQYEPRAAHPLNAIIGFGEMMHREIVGPMGVPAYKEYAQHIHESGMHLLSLVEEMLDLAKVEAGKLQIERQPTRPGVLLAESLVMLRLAAEAAKIEVVVEGAPASWPALDGDAVKLKQVFVNLIGNAIKFTPAGGRVTVSGENNAGTLRIRIRDTGIGIGTQDIPLVQQPFYRVNSVLDGKHQGAGLGLPFAKSVVELHGGTLEIESELDVGTTVTVTLPLLPLPVEAAAESSREPA